MATPTFILPSAPTYTEGFVNGLNVYPNPTNFVANQVPFTRATTATRTNAAGLIELVPYNLLTWSEQFDNVAWPKARCTISANVVNAPNGTLTADKLVEDTTATNTHRVGQLFTFVVGNTYTISCYAKAAERTQIGLSFNLVPIATTDGVVFDLSSGTIALQTAGYTGTITSVGDGWYRCTARKTADATSVRADIGICVSNTAIYTGNGTSGVFIWGAQLVEGTDALPYQLTETRLNRPRVDFSLGGCPSLLLEPQRTNLATFSEQFDNAAWVKSNTSVTANSTTSPSGLVNADTLTADGTSNQHVIQQPLSFTLNVAYSISFYVKKSTNNFVQICTYNVSGGQFANFDINSGVVGTLGVTFGTAPTSSITSVGNGWYRCTMTFTASATASSGVVIALVSSSSAARLEVNTLNTSVFLWGAQIELGAYPTSYIPTTAATVTRNLEVAQLTGAQTLIGQTEGTIYWEGTLSNGLNDIFYLNRSIANSVVLYKNANNTISFRIYYGTSFFNLGNATAYTGTVKIAAAYKSGNSVLYINGVQAGTSSTAFVFTGDLADIVLNASGFFFATDFSKNVKSAAVYNTRLTNAELATLTTL
jgi:hypothetical protein